MPSQIPSRSLRNLGASPLYVPIGFHDRGLPGSGGAYDTTNNSLTSQTLHYTPANYAVRSIRLAFPGFDIGPNGEAERNNTITGYASVYVSRTAFVVPTSASALSGATTLSFLPSTTGNANAIKVGMLVTGTNIASNTYVTNVAPVYAAGGGSVTSMTVTISVATTGAISNGQSITFQGQIYPATFGGKRQFTLEPQSSFIISDPIQVEIAANSTFMVRTSLSFSATGFLLADYPTPASGSTRSNPPEGCQRGASLGDQTLNPIQPSNSGGGFWAPVILAELATNLPLPSVLIIGDSIATGSGDAADGNYRMGFMQKALGQNIPYLSIARGGLSAVNMANIAYGGHYAAGSIINCTDVLLQLCRNDIWNGVTAANLKTYLQNIAAPFINAGKRVWIFTCPPTTTSTDSWATIANQTIANAGRETERQTYNTDIRANYASYGFAGVCDVAALWEDGSNPGKWRVDLGAPTTDGIHPSAVLHTLAITNGVVPASRMVAG